MDATILWKIRGYILAVTLGTLFVFGGIGYLLDLRYGSSPKALFISVLLSFPVSNLLAIRFAKTKISSHTH